MAAYDSHIANIARYLENTADQAGIPIVDVLIDVTDEINVPTSEFTSLDVGFGVGFGINLLDPFADLDPIALRSSFELNAFVSMDGATFLEFFDSLMYLHTDSKSQISIFKVEK